jgi:hypothetical protein
MRFARLNHRTLLLSSLLCINLARALSVHGAGVTLLTHGNSSDTSSWVSGMAAALSARLGGNVPLYRIDVFQGGSGLTNSVTKISGGNPLASFSGEIILMLDWGPVSSGAATTFEVAAAVAPLFGRTNLISELENHALAEFPIHIAGHSRGASLVCELSKRLGEQGLWVDQVTSLDAYPLDSDAPAVSYENVLFSDSYYQTANLFIDGEIVPGSAWRKQTDVSEGYTSFFIDGHSDIHVWYHGTIDLSPAASNGDGVSITSTMRNNWWTGGEDKGTNAGFRYTLQGDGDRLSVTQPNGADSSPIRDGFNRYFDVGDGDTPSNRTPVGGNTGEWPNPIRFDLVTTNVLGQGEVAEFEIYFQWAQPNTSTQLVQVLADPDYNPLNGNEIVLDQGFATGTTAAQVTQGTISVALAGPGLVAGNYHLFVEMTAGNRSRVLYASHPIQVTASTQPLILDITGFTNSTFLLGVNGVAGQTAVLERSTDDLPWTPVATNTLSSSRWEFVEPVEPAFTKTLFRARLATP